MKTVQEIQQFLDETVNKLLGQHRGRVEIVNIQDTTAQVVMSGGCRGCAGARATLKTVVTNHIKHIEPLITEIEDITDHTDKTNAFFKE